MNLRSRVLILASISLPIFLLVFLVSFPYDSLAEILVQRAASHVPVPTEVEGVDYSFPLGIKVGRFFMDSDDRIGTDIVLRNARLRLPLLAFFKGQIEADFRTDVTAFESASAI